METRNVAITLEKAREWYNSNDSSLKEVALQAFSEEELESFDFTTIKTFEDACKVLDLNSKDYYILANLIATSSIASAASFKLNIIRKALNKGQNMDLLKGDIWYPHNLFITKNSSYYKEEIKNKKMAVVARFNVKDQTYLLVGGGAPYGSSSGLGAFSSYGGVGSAHAYVGFLGCATEEIAQHFGKYFAKEIFDAKYGDLIDYKWL